MSSEGPRARTINVGAFARVEGEGALRLQLRGNQVERLQLNVFEPPRYFEALLRGRTYLEPVDITARICGICPVAYSSPRPRPSRRPAGSWSTGRCGPAAAGGGEPGPARRGAGAPMRARGPQSRPMHLLRRAHFLRLDLERG